MSLALACLFATTLTPSRAEVVGYRNAHPIAWMHQLPVGESPGWTGPAWFNLEVGQANVWNKSANFTNLRTGRLLTYEADFEQTTVVANVGVALSDRWALSVEFPYANRNGGFMDAVIDQFHVLIGSDRFLRNRFGEFGNRFYLKDEGIDQLATPHAEGLGSIKAKLKHWLVKWEGDRPGACACGVSVSAQVKVPVQRPEIGLTSGQVDASALLHLGSPIGKDSGWFVTAAYTRLGSNPSFAAWPTLRDQRMFELNLDLGVWSNLGLIASVRTESPLTDAGALRFEPVSVSARGRQFERISTGYNALTQWRTSESLGARWRWGAGQQVNVLVVEDFGFGDPDRVGSFYSNNAPDIAFVTQLHFSL